MARLDGRVGIVTGAARGLGAASDSDFMTGQCLVVGGGSVNH